MRMFLLLIFAFWLALTASIVQYITTARELLEELGAEITPEGTSRYSWVSIFSDGILFVLLGN
jgi:hypothetical protein